MARSFVFSIFTVCILTSSCSKLIYSHVQVMESYRTKDDVIRQFGQPDEIMFSKEDLQWLYNCDTLSNFAATKTKVKINGRYNPIIGIQSAPVNVEQFSNHQKFVVFSFDNQGKVLRWNSSGLDFSQRKAKTWATVGIVVGSVATVSLILFAITADSMFDGLTIPLPF